LKHGLSTPNGQRAFSLDQIGSLGMLVSCSGTGWKVEEQEGKRFCFPYEDAKRMTTGWRVP
jgi:hypothetical protein